MNGVRGGSGGTGRHKIGAVPSQGENRLKERDEDLLLFRELHKKDRVVSLLQPVSDEFEPTGNYAFYRMASAKKGPALEFLAENEKNDYDWLKTPPATPLFPSLEMETNAPDMVVHRELPVFQTLSRFAGNSEAAKRPSSTTSTTLRSKSPSPKSKVPFRSTTPNRKQTINYPLADQKKNSKSAPTFLNPKRSLMVTNTSTDQSNKLDAASTTTTLRKSELPNQRESHLNYLSSNLSKSIGELNSLKTKPTSRGVSPQVMRSVKSTAQILGVSDETPPNLKTQPSISALRSQAERSGSALRGRTGRPAFRDRPETQNFKQTQPVVVEPMVKTVITRRQSCSPSVTRGRKVVLSSSEENIVTTPKGKFQGQVFGSKMVDKFLTARKSSAEEKPGHVFGSRMVDKFLNTRKSSVEEKSDLKGRTYGSINESSGYGRLMAKSSLDVAVKHMHQRKPGDVTAEPEFELETSASHWSSI
ncbi:Collagen alpha-1(XX) chain like [Heracleum sosnowskyi]|uniref:Collagen alpha-1(XX) chain like n=1 Tax=Heracleum sosnowskyi TaxID=360622 RepID=A0AAD8N8D1_9APIA|nr:Collagen alpha-1(XX) chain like [Heracleum sosnowskyi]